MNEEYKEEIRDIKKLLVENNLTYSGQLRFLAYTVKLEEENQQLKEQLEYLRSGEYLNQLKFERNMLENIVQNGEVSKEDKEFIDMTHRNTELLEEYQQLQNNWNELRKYILEDNWSSVNGEITSKLILRKMQEIESSVDNE